MKKIIYSKFGGVEELEMTDSDIPVITETTVLVKVKAVSINPIDWKIRQGEMKLMSGTKFPKGVGIDFSGIVEKTGTATGKFKQGDEIFGSIDQFKGGALAQYILVSEKDISLKPNILSFEKAAAMPVVGFAALQIFDELVSVHEGMEILINGATGGIGMFVTQISKLKGAVVTAVVSEKGIDLAKKWGSDHVIDYKKVNILESKKRYDVFIDLSGRVPFNKAKGIMKPSAVYINTVPGPKQIIGSFLHNLFSKKKYKVLLSKPSALYLEKLAQYATAGMDIVIGKTYDMASFKEAYTEMSKSGVLGKAVFTVGTA